VTLPRFIVTNLPERFAPCKCRGELLLVRDKVSAPRARKRVNQSAQA
jgi:hypothetical protein